MGKRDDKKYLLKWIDLRDSVKFYHGFGHLLFIHLSKVRAQKRQKKIALALLATNAAASSVAVSNDYDVAYLYLSDLEISGAGDFFPKRALDFPS